MHKQTYDLNQRDFHRGHRFFTTTACHFLAEQSCTEKQTGTPDLVVVVKGVIHESGDHLEPSPKIPNIPNILNPHSIPIFLGNFSHIPCEICEMQRKVWEGYRCLSNCLLPQEHELVLQMRTCQAMLKSMLDLFSLLSLTLEASRTSRDYIWNYGK